MNHYLPVQTVVHLSMIGLLFICETALSQQITWKKTLFLCLLLIAGSISFASTVLWAAILPIVFLVFLLFGSFRFQRNSFRRNYLKLIALALTAFLVIGFFTAHYHRPVNHPPIVLPNDFRFWDLLFNLFSFGFGVTYHSLLIGSLLFLAYASIFGFWFRSIRRSDSEKEKTAFWTCLLGSFFVGATLVSIASGRAGFDSDFSKTARYAEFVMPLMIFLLIAVSWIFREERRKGALTSLWLCYFLLYSGHWNFRTYDRIYRLKTICRDRIEQLISNSYSGDDTFQECFPAPITPFLKRAEELKLSFVKDIKMLLEEKNR